MSRSGGRGYAVVGGCFFFSSRRRHTRFDCDWSSDVCSSDLIAYSFLPTVVYNPKAVIPHAASLRQPCGHCARFPTAASRRSLGRVSVPMWLAILSDQLPVVALVGRYPAN